LHRYDQAEDAKRRAAKDTAVFASRPGAVGRVLTPPGGGAPPSLPVGTLTANAIKVTLVVAAQEVLAILWPQGTSHVPINVSARGRMLRARLNAKSLRKVQAAIRAAGTDRVAVVLQAKLDVGDGLAEAGLSVQPRRAAQASD
jgi:hypothetical protein